MDSQDYEPRAATSDSHLSASTTVHGRPDFPKYPVVESVEIDVDSQTDEKKPVGMLRARLEPFLMRFAPLIGLFCILLAVSSTFASLAVLVASNGSATANWPITPSVYLGIITAIGNQSMRYACVQGIIIAWWVKAKKGSTIATLQREWLAGHSIVGALASGRPISLLAIASVASLLVAIDGPLLQSASKVISAPIDAQPIPLHVNLAPEIPSGYTGVYLDVNMTKEGVCDGYFGTKIPTANGWELNSHCTDQSSVMNAILQQTNEHAPLTGVVEGCHTGTCEATLTAPALSISKCKSEQIHVDYYKPWNETVLNTTSIIPRLSFITDLELLPNQRGDLNLVIGYANLDNCVGSLNLTMCTLQSALGRYDVSITNDAVSLKTPIRPSIVAIANNTELPPMLHAHFNSPVKVVPATLAGIAETYRDTFAAVVEYEDNEPLMQSIAGPYMQYISAQNGPCPSFYSPWESTMELLNEFMFRAGAKVAQHPHVPNLKPYMDPGLEVETTVLGKPVGHHNIFRTNYWLFLAAALLEVLCIGLIIPVYWGWRNLGRAYSFSPFEIAAAFDAPMLAGSQCNMGARQIAREHGYRQIRYGEVSGTSGRMAFSDIPYAE